MTNELESSISQEREEKRSEIGVPPPPPFQRRPSSKDSLAKRLHRAGHIYAVYGALDGLSLSYSMLKYSFDVICAGCDTVKSAHMMHEWMVTPGGALAAASEAVVFIGFSLLANLFKRNDKQALKRYIAILWPYCRDTMKRLKNAYKGIRSTLQVASILGGKSLRDLILPIGLTLGVLSVVNRIFYRRILNRRKDMMKSNGQLSADIRACHRLNQQQAEIFRKRISQNQQTESERTWGLFSQVFGGVLDGLYLYMGVMMLAGLAPPLFVAMSAICTVFAALCVASRVYEEYHFQRQLHISRAKTELALCVKAVESLREELLAGENKENKTNIQQTLVKRLQVLSQKRTALHALIKLSYTSAVLSGVQHGLAAYGAIASVLFAVATINTLLMASFPPILLVGGILAGVACLIGFVAHALYKNYLHRRKLDENASKHRSEEALENGADTCPEKQLTDGTLIDETPQFFFQEGFEVVRSFFSGITKGQKSVDYTVTPWQEPNEQDFPVIFGLVAASSAVYSVSLALRAYAQGFGRPPIDVVESDSPPKGGSKNPGPSKGGYRLFDSSREANKAPQSPPSRSARPN